MLVAFGTVIFVVWFLLIISARQNKKITFAANSILVAGLFISGIVYFYSCNPFSSSKFISAGSPVYDSIINEDKNTYNYRISTITPENVHMYYDSIQTLGGYDSLYPKIMFDYVSAINYPNPTNDNPLYINNFSKQNVIQSSGIKYILSRNLANYSGYYQYKKVDDIYIYKSQKEATNYYFATKSQNVTESKILENIKNGLLDYREAQGRDLLNISNAQTGTYEIKKYSPESKIFALNNPEQNYFVLTNAYSQKYVAYLDNASAPMQKVNSTFMAVLVPKGKHELKIIYKDTAFIKSIYISIASMLILAAITTILFTKSSSLGNKKSG
jgi:hypothetical protein